MQQKYPFQSAFARRFLAQGNIEGRIEGRIEGKAEGLRQALALLLRGRSDSEAELLIELLGACPDDALESLGERLAESNTESEAITILQSAAAPLAQAEPRPAG